MSIKKRDGGTIMARPTPLLAFSYGLVWLFLVLLVTVSVASLLFAPTTTSNSTRTTTTLHSSEVPSYLREAYIWTGYRRPGLAIGECLLSVFWLHNESVNIWTHLVAAIYFWNKAMRQLLRARTRPRAAAAVNNNNNRIVLAGFCASQAIVYTASVVAHTFSPAGTTEEGYRMLWRADWSMIAVAMLGVALLLVHLSAIPSIRRRRCWNVAFIASTSSMVVLVNHPSFTRLPPAWKALGALFPIPPLLLFIVDIFYQKPKKQAQQFFIDLLLGPLLLAATGLAIYAAQVPERWAPGYFDWTGGSHTIHHLWTTLFGLWTLHNAQRLMTRRKEEEQQPKEDEGLLPLHASRLSPRPLSKI